MKDYAKSVRVVGTIMVIGSIASACFFGWIVWQTDEKWRAVGGTLAVVLFLVLAFIFAWAVFDNEEDWNEWR